MSVVLMLVAGFFFCVGLYVVSSGVGEDEGHTYRTLLVFVISALFAIAGRI